MKKKKAAGSCAVVIMMCVCMTLFYVAVCSQKADFHTDELYTFQLANSKWGPWFYMPEKEYFSPDLIRQQLVVQPDDTFNYQGVMERESFDRHPFLYALFMHTFPRRVQLVGRAGSKCFICSIGRFCNFSLHEAADEAFCCCRWDGSILRNNLWDGSGSNLYSIICYFNVSDGIDIIYPFEILGGAFSASILCIIGSYQPVRGVNPLLFYCFFVWMLRRLFF